MRIFNNTTAVINTAITGTPESILPNTNSGFIKVTNANKEVIRRLCSRYMITFDNAMEKQTLITLGIRFKEAPTVEIVALD